MKFRSWITLALSLALAAVISVTAPPAKAFNRSSEAYLPGTKIQLQANTWSPSFFWGGRFDWATSAKATEGGARKKVQTIKNTATLRAEGINVTVSEDGISGTTGTVSTVSLSWTNKNSWISDLSGRGMAGIKQNRISRGL